MTTLRTYGLDAIMEDERIFFYELPHNAPLPSSPRCGTKSVVAHFVKGAAHWRRYAHDCKEFDCPMCRSTPKKEGYGYDVKGWEQREALAILDRLEAAQKIKPLSEYPVHSMHSGTKPKRERMHRQAKVYHAVVSPPQKWAKANMYHKAGWKKLWSMMMKVAKSRGLVGGVAMFHPARIPSRWNDRECGSTGPHWHVLGFTHWGDAWDGQVTDVLCRGGFVANRSALKARLQALGQANAKTAYVAGDGWVVKFLDGRKRNLYATAAYVLSHAGRPHVLDEAPQAPIAASPQSSGEIRQSTQGLYHPKQSTRPLGHVPHWFGTCSYNKLKVAEKPEAGIKCQVCKVAVPADEWLPVEWQGVDGAEPPPGDFGSSHIDAWDLPLPGGNLPPWVSVRVSSQEALLRDIRSAGADLA